MSVYVDTLCHHGWKLYDRSVMSCHMFADTRDLTELHRIADAIGLKRTWFQNERLPHYDLTPGKRAMALRAGAIPVDFARAVLIWRALRALPPGPPAAAPTSAHALPGRQATAQAAVKTQLSLFPQADPGPCPADGRVRVVGPREGRKTGAINTASTADSWAGGLSPFLLGPVKLYGIQRSMNVENAWQYSKLYAGYVDESGGPSARYWQWARAGWASTRAVRYPMGRGIAPLYAYWDGERLGYVEARRRIYIPLYSRAVRSTAAYGTLERLYREKGEVTLWDYDGYDHLALGMSYEDVINCETRKMGHAFVLAMMLDGVL